MSKTEIPSIRFRGFDDAWEQRKWSDTVDISTAMVDPKTGLYDDLPHVAPGNIESFTGRLFDNVKLVKDENLISGKFKFKAGDIIYGKINPQLGKYVFAAFSGLTSADAYVLNSKNGVDQKFLYAVLQTQDFFNYSVSVSKRSGMPKINRDELNAYSFAAPSTTEQAKIGAFLLSIDNLITLHQRKFEKLTNVKKSMLKKMFPQNGSSYPEIRFKGFTDPWEQRKLGDNIIEYTEVTTKNNQYPPLTSSRKGIFLQTEYFAGNQIASDNNTGYNIVPYGYFTYRHMSDDEIFHFNINDIVENGIVSTLYPVFTTDESLDSRYLQYQLNYGSEFAKFAILQKQGGSRTYIYLNKLKQLNLTMPKSVEEQKTISAFFMNLDHLITLHQRELEKLQSIKKALLEKMFV